MRRPESKLSIFLGNLAFVGLIIGGLVWYWADHMYQVGMAVTYNRVIPLTLMTILVLSLFLSWVTWKVTKGKF